MVSAQSMEMNYVITFIITLGESSSECFGYQASAKHLLAETLLIPGSKVHFDPLGQGLRLNCVRLWRKKPRS